jgi:HSP20 family protein
MTRDKRTFFERLTGAVPIEEENIMDEDTQAPSLKSNGNAWAAEDQAEGQLMVDVYQTPSEIIIKTIVAGVRPEDLDISVTRDMVTVRGKREAERMINDGDYFHKELYWGSFSRSIVLPQEVDVEEAEANERHGLLTISLPKLNKDKQTKLKVKLVGDK